jgi:hypothetical protein
MQALQGEPGRSSPCKNEISSLRSTQHITRINGPFYMGLWLLTIQCMRNLHHPAITSPYLTSFWPECGSPFSAWVCSHLLHRPLSNPWIHQNIAACYPLLSGHLRFQPFDQVFDRSWPSVSTTVWLKNSTRPQNESSHGRWSVGPASSMAPLSVKLASWLAVCVQTRGQRRGGCTCVFAE